MSSIAQESSTTVGDAVEAETADRSGRIDVLVVGPASRSTGGIAQYVDAQRRRLPDEIDVRVHDNGTADHVLTGGSVGAALAALRAMLLFPLRREPDVVHVHTSHGTAFYRAAWYVLVAALLWRRPVVVHIHGSSFDEFVEAEGVAGALQQLVFRLSDRVIVLSPYWSKVLAERVPPAKLEVLQNAVDPDDYDSDYGADPPHVAFVSHQAERKGVPELVAALERLDEADVEFRASIAGSGSLAGRSEALAESTDRVEYLGYISEAEKRELLAEASVYALPTHAEGLPIALLEGMAAGNAVVTTDVGAIPEVVDEGMGHVIAPGDVDGLTEAFRDLFDDPSAVEAMGRRGRAEVEAEYSWSEIADRLTEIYRSLATESRDGIPARN